MHGAPRLARIASLLAALVLAALLAACGGEVDHHEVVEGESARLGELDYHVELTRFLNPNDDEDSVYLEGQPPEESGENYLGVFLTVRNRDDAEPMRSTSDYSLIDVRGNRFDPASSESPFAFDIGGLVPAGGQLPPPDSVAAMGSAVGGVLIFLVDEAVGQQLPLTLEIADEETATVQLDM